MNHSPCPCCETVGSTHIIHEVSNIPVNNILNISTREEALNFPTHDMALGFCKTCGFMYNVAFDPECPEYSERSEETQACSPVFRKWHQALAERLVDKYDLHNKKIIEIGCGKGEFLALLCEIGNNEGKGFDPAYVPGRLESTASDRMEFIQENYSEKFASEKSDFIACKMTLEHISPVKEFVSIVRRSLGDNRGTRVFFQVPDTLRILEEQAFWDIYYEHCSYFTAGSIARLFRSAGFHVTDVMREYDDQYLTVEAVIAGDEEATTLPQEEDLNELDALATKFSIEVRKTLNQWNERLNQFQEQGRNVVLWGSGSKAVSFLTTLGGRKDIEWVVDINPNRHGMFMATTGQEIIGPDHLIDYKPDVVIIMNQIYQDEIKTDLNRRGLDPEILAL